MWGPVASRVLFRLNGLGLWPNDPVRGRRHIWGRSTKVKVEIALQEELKVIYNRSKPIRGEKSSQNICPRWFETSLFLGNCFKGTLWQRGQILDKGWGRRIKNICKSCYFYIKCFSANSLTALIWRWYLNSEWAALQLVTEGLRRCEMGQREAPIIQFTCVR